MFGGGAVFWPIVIGLAGLALLWRQADEAQRERWFDSTERLDPVRMVFGSGGWASYARVAAGVLLVGVAFAVVGLNGTSFGEARIAVIAGLVGVVGLALVIGPWVLRLASDLGAEREERIRTQERADVAAHLHDSVLQTLALIQKSSHDPTTVARLARAQERDLRSWLYVGESTDERSLAGALRSAAAEVEDTHGVSVDVVAVGDCELDELAAPDRPGHPRGGHQRRQARRHRPGRRLRRGHRRRRRRVRPRPRRRLRPRRRARGPATASAAASSTGWSGTAAPPRSAPPRRGHRGPAAPAPPAQLHRGEP